MILTNISSNPVSFELRKDSGTRIELMPGSKLETIDHIVLSDELMELMDKDIIELVPFSQIPEITPSISIRTHSFEAIMKEDLLGGEVGYFFSSDISVQSFSWFVSEELKFKDGRVCSWKAFIKDPPSLICKEQSPLIGSGGACNPMMAVPKNGKIYNSPLVLNSDCMFVYIRSEEENYPLIDGHIQFSFIVRSYE